MPAMIYTRFKFTASRFADESYSPGGSSGLVWLSSVRPTPNSGAQMVLHLNPPSIWIQDAKREAFPFPAKLCFSELHQPPYMGHIAPQQKCCQWDIIALFLDHLPFMLKRFRSPVLFRIFSLFQAIGGVPSNRTIDDTNGDSVTGARPIYLPNGPWGGAGCKGCAIQPDPSRAHNGTWTAATFHPELMNMSISFEFQGTAVYVFFINANTQAAGVTTLTECDFYVDGTYSSSYQHAPTASTELDYNVLAFSATDLVNSDHTISIITANKSYSTFLNFDYATYTTDNEITISSPSPLIHPSLPTSSSTLSTLPRSSLPDSPPVPNPSRSPNPSHESTLKKGPSIGVIVGETIGGIVGLGILTALLLLWYFRSRVKKSTLQTEKQSHAYAYASQMGEPLRRNPDSPPPPSSTKPPFYGSEQAVGLRGFILQKYEEALPRYSPARSAPVLHVNSVMTSSSFSSPYRESVASSATPANYHAEAPLPILEPNRRRYDGYEQDGYLKPLRPLGYEMMRRMQELSAPPGPR
ncbi:hypothetical protein BD779DRAFT_1670970 [Infundibulicybe gibba]|nr:hypothetical protein BD779DRAFT_1670970 [Infundibulicybe gibba]